MTEKRTTSGNTTAKLLDSFPKGLCFIQKKKNSSWDDVYAVCAFTHSVAMELADSWSDCNADSLAHKKVSFA